MSIQDVVAVPLKSRLLDGGTKYLKPIQNFILVEREPDVRSFGRIIGVTSASSFDVTLSRVLSISDRAKVSTKRGPLAIGDRVLSVRVIQTRVEDIELRTDEDNNKVSFIPDEHVLAVVTDNELLPANDLYLLKAMPDRRMYGLIELIGSANLEMHSSEILSCGPLTSYGEPGNFAVHLRVNGVEIDSDPIKRRFGSGLKLIREKSLHGLSFSKIDDSPELEQNPDYVPEQPHRGLGLG